MSRRAIYLLGMSSAFVLGCIQSPLAWSPDGRWLAYTVAVRPVSTLPSPGWLFEVGAGGVKRPRLVESPRRPAATSYRIWATRPDSGVSVLLEDSQGPLTAPCWSPDGKTLAFGRLVAEEEGRGRFEVVVQESPERKRILLKHALEAYPARASELPSLALAWSPDGRYLAIPLFQQTLGVAIIRADNGRILKVVEDAYFPSWSPDGTKLAFVRGTDFATLLYLDTNFGAPRVLVDIGKTNQAPVWFKQSILVVARRPGGPGGNALVRRSELLRVPIDGSKVEAIPLVDTADRDKQFLGASFGFDREGDNLFYAVDILGEPSVVTWYLPRTKETYRRDNPVDFKVRVGAFAVAPNGKTVALRAGHPDDFLPPGLWDLASNRFSPMVADDSARVEWVLALVAGAKAVLRDHLPAMVNGPGRMVERPSVLPIPGEIASNAEALTRLQRLAKIGRPLCDRPASAPPAEPEVGALLDEARLFFDYLRGDYDAALASLDRLESRTASPEARLRLLSVRAQVFLGQNEDERAGETIAYLQSIEPHSPRRFEETPAGPVLTEESHSTRGWSSYLAERAKRLRESGGVADEDGENLGPDADPDGPMMPFAPPNFVDVPVRVRPGGVIERVAPVPPLPRRRLPRVLPPAPVPPTPRGVRLGRTSK